MVGLLLALIIAFVYSWVITLVILGFVPFMVIASALKTLLLAKQATRNKKSQTEAGKVIDIVKIVYYFTLNAVYIKKL